MAVEQSDLQIILWLVVGVGLIGAEIVVPGFILFPFGLGAMLAAAAAWAGASVVIQFLVFVVVSGIGLVALRPLGRRLNKAGDQSDIGSARLIGRQATVTVSVDDDHGMIKVAGEDWRAQSSDGSPLPRGAKVQVLEIRGNIVIVTPADADIPEET